MTRSKVVEAREAVIAAARALMLHIAAGAPVDSLGYMNGLCESVVALDALDPAMIVNEPGKSVVGSPETSGEAALLLTPKSGSLQLRVLHAFASSIDGLLTDEMCERHLRLSHQTLSSARNALVEKGWLQDSRQRALTSSKRKAILWQLTPTAMAQLKGRAPSTQ